MGPSPHIQRLFLNPHQRGFIRIGCQGFFQFFHRVGIQLFNPKNGHIVPTGFLSFLGEVVVDLPGTEENARGLRGFLSRVFQNLLEAAFGQVFNTRNSSRGRSKDLGVITTSGFRLPRFTWRRNAWNN